VRDDVAGRTDRRLRCCQLIDHVYRPHRRKLSDCRFGKRQLSDELSGRATRPGCALSTASLWSRLLPPQFRRNVGVPDLRLGAYRWAARCVVQHVGVGKSKASPVLYDLPGVSQNRRIANSYSTERQVLRTLRNPASLVV
jgi:hypothetical protein